MSTPTPSANTRTLVRDLPAAHGQPDVTLQGWVHRRRDLGGLIFLTLRDRSGTVQVQVPPDSAAYAVAEELRSEFVITVRGAVVQRPESQRRGGVADFEVLASELTVLARAQTPPFELDKGDEVAEEIRLKYRYLDLRRETMQRHLRLRSRVIATMTEYLSARDFVQIETPVLTKSTPEGARDFLVPSRLHPGEAYALPQSPQLYKQLLMVGGLERYFQFARCFRDEDLRADRQLDFTQLDLEMSFAGQEEILGLLEGLIRHTFREVLEHELPDPFPRLSYRDAMDRYGSDKPDIRFGLELAEAGDLFAGSDFRAFAGAESVKVLAAPELSRGQIAKLERIAKQNGAAGLAWARLSGGALTEGVSKFLGAQAPELIARSGAEDGSTLLMVASSWDTACQALGAVRLGLRDLFGLVPGDAPYAPLWVLDFPQLEWEPEKERWTFKHHPFTQPHPDDLHLFGTERQGEIRAQAYDLVLDGFEMGSGSLRIHDPEIQKKMFTAIGMSDEEARRQFGFFLEALTYGTPPHGGNAWGLDRLIMVMARTASIREVIAFPKNNHGVDLMVQAPGEPAPEQWAELGLRVERPQD